MREFITFTKKEFMESKRTYKLFTMFILFAILGVMNPLIAKMTTQMLKSIQTDSMTITIADPTAFDSWAQFYKNVAQLGLIVLGIVFGSMLSGEITKGTLINIVTKGIKRKTILCAKLFVSVIIWTVSYAIAFFITYGYTIYLWPDDQLSNLFIAAAFVWVFGVMLLALGLFGNTFFNSTGMSLLFTGGCVVAIMICNIFPKISKFNPLKLIMNNLSLIKEQSQVSDFTKPLGVCIIISIVAIVSSCFIFDKKHI